MANSINTNSPPFPYPLIEAFDGILLSLDDRLGTCIRRVTLAADFFHGSISICGKDGSEAGCETRSGVDRLEGLRDRLTDLEVALSRLGI